jgi:choice-of-anchor B domain-containing protein
MHRRLATLAAAILVALAATPLFAQPGRNLELKAHFHDFPPSSGAPFASGYASCWSYVHGDGREYAVIGHEDGIAIYNVTDVNNCYFVDSIPGPRSLWREMKSYRNWIYVVTEAAGASNGAQPGLQIIRMTDPENPVLVSTYTGTFSRSHTVSIDTTRALLYCNGTNALSAPSPPGPARGVRILSLANPEAPVEVGRWPQVGFETAENYVHDCVPVGNRLYASSIYIGTQRILDVTNPAAPTQISAWTYPGAGLTHNAWPSADGKFIYVTDEQNGQTLRVFDISTPTSPVLVNEWTSNPQAIIHNAHVKGNDLFLANYTEGVRVLDITDPAHPAEFAWSDTYPAASGGYGGVWGVCPYFPSGTVITSDMQTGLYVYRLNRNYGTVRVEVHDPGSSAGHAGHSTHAALDEATVYVETQGDSAKTGADGVAQFAPNPGMHTIRVRKFGYEDAVANVLVNAGDRDTVTVLLTPKAVATLYGTIRDASSQAVLAEAQVSLAYTPVHQHTDANGQYALLSVPDDLYRVEVQRPGYIPLAYDRRIGPGFDGTQDYFLRAASFWNPMASSGGWTVGGLGTGDNASTGQWTWGEPFGTGTAVPVAPGRAERNAVKACETEVFAASIGRDRRATPFHEGHEAEGATAGAAQPDKDRSPNPDSTCFFTGQGQNPAAIDEMDVDGGITTLTSPAMNTTGLVEPTIGVWLWFYSQFRAREDWLAVLISGNNGASWTAVDTLRGIHNHWEHHAIPVANYVTPGTQVRLRFVAADLGTPSVVEAAVDDITVYDASLPSVAVGDGALHPLAFRRVWPNPSSGEVTLVLDLPTAGPADVEILDLSGRRVRSLHHGSASPGMLSLYWDGRDDHGRATAAGLYFVRAATPAGAARTRIARIR